MKMNRSNLIAVNALLLAMVLGFGTVNSARVAAQQMSDIPHDLHFIDMMIMHHQEGIEMAKLAETKAQNAGVKAFAIKTAADQQKDIEELQSYRNQWYAGKPMMDHAMMQSMMQSMHPDMKMDMEDIRRKLRAASGVEFDRLFLDTMTHHHMMAIDMSKDAVNKAEHPALKEFARQAVNKQQSEIAEMSKLKRTGTSKKKAAASQTKTTHKH